MNHLLVVGLLLLAFWLRLENLDTYPPGVSNDEAVNVVDSFHISSVWRYPLYEDYGRPEPMYRFVLAAGVTLWGPGIWSCRITSALIGLITVPLAYWAARMCLLDLKLDLRRIGGFAAAAVLAVAISHVTLSRALYRGILQPPIMLLFVGFLLRGLHTDRRRDFALSGLCLGLLFYTYTAALLVPASLAAVALSLLFFRRKTWRVWLPGLVILGLVFFLLVLPIGVRLLTYPETVLGRAGGVSSNWMQDLGDRLVRVAEQFFVPGGGDINPQYNVEEVPLLPPVFNFFFVLGLAGLAIRFRQPSSALLAALLIACAIPVLASNEIPHGLRIMGEFAVFPLIVGVGAAVVLVVVRAVASYGQPQIRNVSLKPVLTIGFSLVLAVVTVWNAAYARETYTAYWGKPYVWPVYGGMQIGDWFFRPDRREFARWIAAQEGPLLAPMDELDMATTRAWLLRSYPNVTTGGDSFDVPADTVVVVPWALELGDLRRETRQYALLQDGTITLLPPLSAETHVALMDGIDEAEAIMRTDGDLMARVMPLAEGPALAFDLPASPQAVVTSVAFDDLAQIVSWRGPETLDGDERSATYTLDWVALQPLGRFYTSFLQLQTQSGERVAGDDHDVWRWLFPMTQWQMDDAIPDAHPLQLPGDLQPGAYRLVAGLYPFIGNRLPAATPEGDPLGDAPTIGWIKVSQLEMPPPDQGVLAVDATLGDVFALRGATAVLLEDGRIRVTLDWESLVERPDIDATIFVHVIDQDGELVAQNDSRPWNGQYPTFIWGRGERVRTEHIFDIEGAATGDLHLLVGMYTFPDLARLPVVQNGQLAPDGRVSLGVFATLFAG